MDLSLDHDPEVNLKKGSSELLKLEHLQVQDLSGPQELPRLRTIKNEDQVQDYDTISISIIVIFTLLFCFVYAPILS